MNADEKRNHGKSDKRPPRPAGDAVQNTIICPCEEFSLSDMQSALNANPGISYEAFIASTGAGGKCTACLLDLEYYFVNLPRAAPSKADRGGRVRRRQGLPFKQRLYRIIDRLTPELPIKLYDYFPVLFGPNLDQWAWLANYSLLYEDTYIAPPFQIDICLRDGDGRTVWQNRSTLESGEDIRECLSARLRDAAIERQDNASSTMVAELGIGSVRMLRRGRRAGFRGTTRPQIEIITQVSACAVHGQGASVNTGGRFTCLYRPGEERTFLSIMNAGPKPVTVEFFYPTGVHDEAGQAAPAGCVVVPPYGAQIHEIRFSGDQASRLEGQPYKIIWRGRGKYKAHIIVASPSLDRFSIDHV